MLNKSFFFQQGRLRPRGTTFRINTSLVATGTSNANTYRIYFNSAFSGNILWGDGITEVKSGVSSILSHIYAIPGIYEITLIPNPGSVAHIRLRDDFPKLMKFIDFGTNCKLASYCFQNCINADLSEVIGLPILEGESTFGLFQNFKGYPSINNSELWDFGKVTSMFSFLNNSTINSPFNINSNVLTDASYFLFAANSMIAKINLNAPNLITFTNAVMNNTAFNQDISTWVINKNANITSFAQGKTFTNFSAENYDKALEMFKNTFVGTGRTTAKSTNFGTIKRTALGTVMRDSLVADGWTWTDGGQI